MFKGQRVEYTLWIRFRRYIYADVFRSRPADGSPRALRTCISPGRRGQASPGRRARRRSDRGARDGASGDVRMLRRRPRSSPRSSRRTTTRARRSRSRTSSSARDDMLPRLLCDQRPTDSPRRQRGPLIARSQLIDGCSVYYTRERFQ